MMRKNGIKILFLMVVLELVACQSTCKYEVEDRLFNCYVDYFQEKNIDLNKTIDKTEKILKGHGIIQSISGKEIVKTISLMNEENDIPIMISSNLVDSLTYLRDINLSLHEELFSGCQISNLSFQNSKLNDLIGVFDELARKVDISSQIFFTEVLKVYDAEDFENKYYQMLFLLGMGKFILVYHEGLIP
jgi:hypothetical protein